MVPEEMEKLPEKIEKLPEDMDKLPETYKHFLGFSGNFFERLSKGWDSQKHGKIQCLKIRQPFEKVSGSFR